MGWDPRCSPHPQPVHLITSKQPWCGASTAAQLFLGILGMLFSATLLHSVLVVFGLVNQRTVHHIRPTMGTDDLRRLGSHTLDFVLQHIWAILSMLFLATIGVAVLVDSGLVNQRTVHHTRPTSKPWRLRDRILDLINTAKQQFSAMLYMLYSATVVPSVLVVSGLVNQRTVHHRPTRGKPWRLGGRTLDHASTALQHFLVFLRCCIRRRCSSLS